MVEPSETAESSRGLFSRINRWIAAVILTLLLIISALLNFTGVDFGLPQLTHWDERWIAGPALNLLKVGRIVGQNKEVPFHYPHLYIYAQASAFATAYVWEHARGNVFSVDENGIKRHYRAKIHDLGATGWWPRLYKAGRSLTALIGVAAVALVFAIGLRLRSSFVGLVGAGALAVSPLFVANSHYISVNVPAAFLALLALFIMLRLFAEPKWPLLTVALSGFVCGLAVSTKYNAVAILAVLLLAVVLSLRRTRLLYGLLIAPFSAVIGFIVGTPQALTTPTIFLQDVTQQIIYYRFQGHAFTEQANPLVSYLIFLFVDGLGIGLSLLAILGLYVAVRKFGRAGVLVVAFTVIFLIEMGASNAYFTRNLTIIAPALALLSGFGALQIAHWIEKTGLKKQRLVVVCVVVVLALPSVWGAFGISSLLASPNNFLLAGNWIEENIPQGSAVFIERADSSATVPLSPETGLKVDYRPAAPQLTLQRLLEYDYVVTWQHGPHRVDRYRYGIPPFLPGGYAQLDTRYGNRGMVEMWERFRKEAELIREFDPFALGSQGPTIHIWRVSK